MHDRNGTPIKKGDIVSIEAIIDTEYGGEDYCNVQVKIGFEKPHGPDNVTNSITLNARQTLLLRRA